MLQKKKQVIAFLLIELAIFALFVYQLYRVIKIDFVLRTFSFSENFFDIVVLVLLIILFLAVFGIERKRNHEVYLIQEEADKLIKDTIKRKVKEAKDDPKLPALLMIEFLFAVTIAASIAAYLDPEWAIIKWEKYGFEASLSPIINAVVFVVIVVVLLFMYNVTKNYRVERKGKS